MDNVDNSKKGLNLTDYKLKASNKRINKIMTAKRKTININATEGIIEGSLVDMPFITCKKTNEIINVVNYNWLDSNGIQHGVEIVGGKYGIPTTEEFDVLIALLKIFATNNKIEFGEAVNEENYNINNPEMIITFSLNQIAREMGKKSFSSSVLNRIKQAIYTLKQTTISNRQAGALYDINNKKYLESSEKLFSIIEEANFYSLQAHKKSPKKDLNSVRLGKFFYQSIKGGYFKYINYDTYKQLKNGVAKRIFLCLTKWRNNKLYITLKYDTLYSRIPLEDDIPKKQKKATLKRACNALVKIDYLQSYEMKQHYVTFIFGNNKIKGSLKGVVEITKS